MDTYQVLTLMIMFGTLVATIMKNGEKNNRSAGQLITVIE
jgi:hypothetical protein